MAFKIHVDLFFAPPLGLTNLSMILLIFIMFVFFSCLTFRELLCYNSKSILTVPCCSILPLLLLFSSSSRLPELLTTTSSMGSHRLASTPCINSAFLVHPKYHELRSTYHHKFLKICSQRCILTLWYLLPSFSFVLLFCVFLFSII